MTEKLMTREEASALLEIPPEQLERWVEEGRLSAFQIGGEFLRFRREELVRFKRERFQPPETRVASQRSGANMMEVRYSVMDGLKDFFYFNDFYLFSLLFVFFALWAILVL